MVCAHDKKRGNRDNIREDTEMKIMRDCARRRSRLRWWDSVTGDTKAWKIRKK